MQYDYTVQAPGGVFTAKGISYAPEVYRLMLPAGHSILSSTVVSAAPAPQVTTTTQTSTPTVDTGKPKSSLLALGVIALGLWAVWEWS